MYNTFEGLSSKIYKKILPHLFSSKYLGGNFSISEDLEFYDYVGNQTGLKISFYRIFVNNNFPQLFNYAASAYIKDFRVITAGASGHILDSEMVKIKAKGEFLERLSSYFDIDLASKYNYDFSKIKLKKNKFYVKSFLSFIFLDFRVSEIFYGVNRFFPELDYKYEDLRKGIIKQPTTNGGAGHFTYKKAVLGGWLELIQRDSFLVYWLNTISPKKIDIETYLSNTFDNTHDFLILKDIINKLKKHSLEFYFLDITSDLNIPSVCFVIKTKGKYGTVIGLGASSGFDADSNLLSSLYESISVTSLNYTSEPYYLNENYIPFTDSKIGRKERLSLYTTDKMHDKFKFFTESKETISVENWSKLYKYNILNISKLENINPEKNHKEALRYLKEFFKYKNKENKNYNVYVYNIKNKILKYFDYKVVRVLCPALYSIYLNENYADPNHPRLIEFVKNKGLEKVAKLNIWPHPFP